MAFVFTLAETETQVGALDILSGQFDLSIVTTTPSISNTTVSNLTLSNVAPYLLTNNSSTTTWSFQDFVLPLNSYSVAPIGFVISKRSSTNFATTDRVIYYSEFTNSLDQVVVYLPGLYRINVSFKSTGLINFNSTNEYISGDYINNEAYPKGLIYLMGSNNNVTTYTNPTPNKITNRFRTNGGVTTGPITLSTDRIIGTATTCARLLLNVLLDRKIRVGKFGWNASITATAPFSLYGSNTITAINDASVDVTTNWTLLGSISNCVFGWNFITVTNSTYWSYFKLESNSDSINIIEIEFYSSSILSSTLNIV